MEISVIIPTYNEKSVLADCVESLGFQTERDFEIVIVDDGSTDGSQEILKNLEKNLRNFRFFTQSHKGPGAARNLGASKARGRILVFVDSDMTFDKDFLKSLILPIRSNQFKGTFSKEEYVSNWENVWARCWNINENWQEKRRHFKNYPDSQPVFRAILKSEFDRVHGFTPGGYDDDWSLSKKLGYYATSAEGAVFYHKNPSNLSEIFYHAKWVGKRKYKLGILGFAAALLRSSFPVSVMVGLFKSIKFKEPAFLIFKTVYDFGIFYGILNYLITGKSSK